MGVVTVDRIDAWTASADARASEIEALESGRVLHFTRLAFPLGPGEEALLDPALSDGRAKNIGYDPATGRVSGTAAAGERHQALRAFVDRFTRSARGLVEGLFPAYRGQLALGLASFRPVGVEGRATSDRKDDTRLHVDAFASRPNQGRRILRLFCNIDPQGRPRQWLVGEPFDAYARRFAARARAQLPGEGAVLQALRLTKSRRTAYDHVMLAMHDAGKLDDGYQADAPREPYDFPAGSTWLCFTDQVLHAALGGQFLLEQTFYLPVAAMAEPERSPLRVLERLANRPLT